MENDPNGVVVVQRHRQIKLELLRDYPAECYATGASAVNGVLSEDASALPFRLSLISQSLTPAGALDDLIVLGGEIGQQPAVRKFVIGMMPWFFQYDGSKDWPGLEDYVLKMRMFFKNGALGPPPTAGARTRLTFKKIRLSSGSS